MNLAPTKPTGRERSPGKPRLLAVVAALLTVAALITVGQVDAGRRLRRAAGRLAALNLPEGTRSTVLQRQILALPHCLPVYGSSELAIAQPTRPDRFFHRQADGFDVRVVGQAGDRCLPMLQELAALGPAARGRKVAVFLSPGWFLPNPDARERDHSTHGQFAATSSTLQMGETALNRELPTALRREIARRLLRHDAVIGERSPLLRAVLRSVAAPGPWPGVSLAALAPLLRLEDALLILQERWHWRAVSREHRHDAAGTYQARHKWQGWTRLEADVARAQAKRARGRGRQAAGAERETEGRRPRTDQDANFLRSMQAAPEWGDLDLLLRTAHGLGVRLLLLNQPINGPWSDAHGVTARARQAYYQRIAQVAAEHKVALRDFSAHEEDSAFFLDEVHPSAKAWVWYDQALEEFWRRKG